MLRKRIRPSTLLIVVAATVVLAGCSAATGPLDEESERAIVEDVEERIEEIDGFTATQELQTSVNGTATTRLRVWARPETGEMRTEVLAPDERAGDVTVMGTGTLWNYDRSANAVTRTNVSTDRRSMGLQGGQLDELVERYDVTYEGTVQLDGRRTHKLRLTTDETADRTAVNGTITMWVDAEKRFPAQLTYEYGETGRVTIRYENVSINPGIPDERFTFEPPEGASVETMDVDIERFDTRSGLAEETERAVPDPDLPDGFEFERGTLLNGSYSLQYSNGSARLLVTAHDASETAADGGESVSVAGRDGTYRSFGDTRLVRWGCGETAYSVAGDASRTDLMAVADSVGCP